MVSDKEYIDFVCTQLEGAGNVRARKMFGDWCIYIDEMPVILVCDEICYVKKLPELEPLMSGAECGFPYPGAKEHYILDVEHRGEMLPVVHLLVETLPLYQKKKSRK